MVYPFPKASRDIASLAIWSSHKVAASFSSVNEARPRLGREAEQIVHEKVDDVARA
jgi:hypothetical protein